MALEIDNHTLHVLRMLAGGHGQSVDEYLQLVISYHCKHLATDTDRGLAFATLKCLNYKSIPELSSVLLLNTMLGYDVVGNAGENNS